MHGMLMRMVKSSEELAELIEGTISRHSLRGWVLYSNELAGKTISLPVPHGYRARWGAGMRRPWCRGTDSRSRRNRIGRALR